MACLRLEPRARMNWGIPPFPQWFFVAWCIIKEWMLLHGAVLKYRDNFTFTFTLGTWLSYHHHHLGKEGLHFHSPVKWLRHEFRFVRKALIMNRPKMAAAKFSRESTRAVWKVRGLTLLLRVGTLWRCGDGLFFEVPPLASDALLITLHPLLENMLQTVRHKLQEDSGTGGFDLSRSFLRL
jgi:hypothetical protein